MIAAVGYVLATWAVYALVAGLFVLPVGLIRWRMARLYWHTHEGGSAGYRRDCLLLCLPLLFLVLGLVASAILARTYGFGIALFVMPSAMAFAVGLSMAPPFKRASQRLINARAPLEPANVR
ncbi:MAG: hypothetical protein WCI21_01400 [Alphaproteobacteria bacterium]